MLELGHKLLTLFEQHTELTRLTQDLTRRIETLTAEVHQKLAANNP